MRHRIKKRIGFILVIVLIILGVTAILVAAHFKGYELTIKVEKDAYVYEYYPDRNYGEGDYLRVGNYDLGKIQAFYFFNISSLPDGWKEVHITVNFDFASSPVDVGANLTYESWDEMTITWNNKPDDGKYRGHILCDGFDFRIPLRPDQIINDGVGVCLYGRGGVEDGYIQGNSREGASRSNDIAWVELSYTGIDPTILTGLSIAGIVILIVIAAIVVICLIVILNPKFSENSRNRKKIMNRNDFDANWINAYIGKTAIPATLEKEINQYITLKLEYGRAFIYVNGKRFIQCIRLILNIPKEYVPLYDEVDSIDEAAKLYSTHIHQNRIIGGRMGARWPNQIHNITPEQEFWGHCSNIQAWVEHDYDTRILMSNISFPLLRELTQAGDPIAAKVFKEEIALRLESGYPSVVQYLLNQGYLKHFSPSEFKTILESTNLIKNISSKPSMLSRFLQSCVSKFPTLLGDILLQILKLPEGKNILIRSISVKPGPPFRPYFRLIPQFLHTIKAALEGLFIQVDEKIDEDIIDCIYVIENNIKRQDINLPFVSGKSYLEAIRNVVLNNMPLDNLNDAGVEEKLQIKHKLLGELRKTQSKCSYCGKMIPRGQDTCDWCGHKKDDEEDFFPYPFIFKPPGGGGGSMKGTIAVSVKVKSQA